MSYTQTRVECPPYQPTETPAYGPTTKTFAGNLASAAGLVLQSVTTDTTDQYDANYGYPGYSNYYIRIYNGTTSLHVGLMGINPSTTVTLATLTRSMAQYTSTYWEVIKSVDFCGIKATYGASTDLILFMTLTSSLDGSRVKACGTGLRFYSDSVAAPTSTSTVYLDTPGLTVPSAQINEMSTNEYLVFESFFRATGTNTVDIKAPYTYKGHGLYWLNGPTGIGSGRFYTDGDLTFLGFGSNNGILI